MEASFICILFPLDGSAMILKCFGKTIFLRAREIKLFHQKSSCLWDCLHLQDLNQIGIAWKECLILEFSGRYFPSFGIKPEIYWIQSFFLDLFFVFGLNMNQKKIQIRILFTQWELQKQPFTLHHGRSPVNLLHNSRTSFLKNTSERLLLELSTRRDKSNDKVRTTKSLFQEKDEEQRLKILGIFQDFGNIDGVDVVKGQQLPFYRHLRVIMFSRSSCLDFSLFTNDRNKNVAWRYFILSFNIFSQVFYFFRFRFPVGIVGSWNGIRARNKQLFKQSFL